MSTIPLRVRTAVRTICVTKSAAVKTHRASQGFESMTFSDEQKFISKMWARLSESPTMTQHSISVTYHTEMPTGEHSHKLLTQHAIEVIKAAIESGQYDDRINAREPPFMAPDQNPDMYSPVSCQICHSRVKHSHPEVVFLLQRLCRTPCPLCQMQSWPLCGHTNVTNWLPCLGSKP